MVDEHERGHRLHDGHGAGQHTGIVAAATRELGRPAVHVDSRLRAQDRGGGLEGDAKADLLAIADAPLHAAAAVGPGTHLALPVLKEVVVLGTLEQRTGKAAADLEPLGGRQREHGFGEIGFKPVEHRHAPHAALDETADRVAIGAHRLDARDHPRRGGGVRTTDGRVLDLVERGKVIERVSREVVDPRDKRANLHPAGKLEDLLRDGAGRHATDGLARRRPASALVIADPELGLISEVRVRRTELLPHLVVCAGTGVGVPDEH